MKKHNLPLILVWSRIPLMIVIVILAVVQPAEYAGIVSATIFLALITDVLDGILARKWGVSSVALRKLDSNVDQVFWVVVITTVFILRFTLIEPFLMWIFGVVVLEGMAYLISGIRFRKTVATHTILAKIWTLSILLLLLELLLFHSTATLIPCLVLGILSRVEIILILLIIKTWVSDVPNLRAAIQIRKGKEVKRSKWFNG